MWATKWGIPCTADGGFCFADYLKAAIVAGQSDNKVFGVRVMWGSMTEIVVALKTIHPRFTGSDCELLSRALGCTKFIYLERSDVVAQAISRLRAEQTNVWHKTKLEEFIPTLIEPQYDFDQIHRFVQEIDEHNAAWKEWFRQSGIEPCHVRYEELDRTPIGTTCRILDFLQVELPADRQIRASNKRLADQVSNEWAERYRTELRKQG